MADGFVRWAARRPQDTHRATNGFTRLERMATMQQVCDVIQLERDEQVA